MADGREKLKQWLANLPGIFLGIQILTKGFEKLPDFSHFPLHISFLFLAGLFIIGGSLLHHRLEKRVKNVHALFHLIEGAVMMVSALILFEKGKMRMPLFILFIGCVYVILGLFARHLNEENLQRTGRRLLHWLGLAFLAAGLTAVILNWFHDRDGWVFGVAGILIIAGLFYTLGKNWIITRLQKQQQTKQREHPPAIEPE